MHSTCTSEPDAQAGLVFLFILGRRSQGQWSGLERARLFALLSTSLGAAFFSVAPELLRAAGEPDTWLRVAHALLVAYQAGAIAFYFSRARPDQHQLFADRVGALLLTGLGVVLLATQVAVVLGWPGDLAGLLYLLLVGSANFVLLQHEHEHRSFKLRIGEVREVGIASTSPQGPERGPFRMCPRNQGKTRMGDRVVQKSAALLLGSESRFPGRLKL